MHPKPPFAQTLTLGDVAGARVADCSFHCQVHLGSAGLVAILGDSTAERSRAFANGPGHNALAAGAGGLALGLLTLLQVADDVVGRLLGRAPGHATRVGQRGGQLQGAGAVQFLALGVLAGGVLPCVVQVAMVDRIAAGWHTQ